MGVIPKIVLIHSIGLSLCIFVGSIAVEKYIKIGNLSEFFILFCVAILIPMITGVIGYKIIRKHNGQEEI